MYVVGINVRPVRVKYQEEEYWNGFDQWVGLTYLSSAIATVKVEEPQAITLKILALLLLFWKIIIRLNAKPNQHNIFNSIWMKVSIPFWEILETKWLFMEVCTFLL